MKEQEIENNKLRHELILQAEKLIEIINKYPDSFKELRKNINKGLECFLNKVYEMDKGND